MMTERVGPGSALGARPPSGLGAPGSRAPQSSSGGSPARPPSSVGSNPRPAMASRPTHSSNGSVPVSRPVSSTGPRPPSNSGPPNNRPPGYHGGPDDNDKSLKMKIKRTKSGRQEIVSVGSEPEERSDGEGSRDSSCSPVRRPPSPLGGPPKTPTGPPKTPTGPPTPTSNARSPGSADLTNGIAGGPQHKRMKVDAGTSTDAATLTEPEWLGPCEPGTAVNLEGIVWHETDAGVLVVNVTWRGKTYVGTLLDCTRHTNQWSAPRFTDSPEPGGKGRGKRGRSSVAAPSEVEPRKNLRSSKAKGKGKGGKGASSSSKEDEFNFPAPSSPAKDSGKRKGRPDDLEEAKKRKRNAGSDQEEAEKTEPEEEEEKEETTPPPPPPMKREPRPVVYSYTMLECPRKDCSKQYKEEEGLKWHLSHSHPEYIDANGQIKDTATVEREQEERKRRARARREGKAEERANAAAASSSSAPLPKTPKLEPGVGKAATPSRPSPKPATSTPHTPARLPGQLPAGLIAKSKVSEPSSVTVSSPSAAHSSPSVAHPQLEEVKRRGGEVNSPGPGSPLASQEKPPANSPAYSDISDDGDDSRGSREAPPPAPKSLAPPLPPAPISSVAQPHLGPPRSLPQQHNPRVSTPSSVYPRTSTPSNYSTPSTAPTRPSSRPSPTSVSLISPSCGPNPGTPEYHKYLAANGFPPIPYPYPVGMDPNHHMMLLKTDPMYKLKWEKDRAEREKAFKEQLDRDQGKFSGLSLIKEEKVSRKEKQAEDLRKREPSGGSRGGTPSLISVKAEFREKDDVKREVKMEEQGVKPTMETRGPPPGPQTFGYMHPSLLRPGMPPYSMAGMTGLPPPHFDPIMASAAMMGSPSPYGLPPYLSPAAMAMGGPRPPGFPGFPGDPLRSPFPGLASPEDVARLGMSGAPPGMSGTKALDLLQQHASQYYANQKLAELQERALKSPSSSISSSMSSAGMQTASPTVHASKPVTTMAGKDSPTPTSAASADKSKSPPPLRHVHTHTHTHIGLGYPLLPPVAGSLPAVPPGLPPGALPPPSVGVSTLPPGAASFPPSGPYPGKSP